MKKNLKDFPFFFLPLYRWMVCSCMPPWHCLQSEIQPADRKSKRFHWPSFVMETFPKCLSVWLCTRFGNTHKFTSSWQPPISPTWRKTSGPDKGERGQSSLWKTEGAPAVAQRKIRAFRRENGHPVTRSSHHFALHDKLHQSNTKDPHDVLRRVDLVPELKDCVKSEAVKPLFAYMRKNNYFLNSMAPSTHMFLMRNLIEHRKVFCNTQLLET